MSIRILTGDCREVFRYGGEHGPFDMIVGDAPYGDTSLAWDRRVDGWIACARDQLKPTGSLWVFGSLRFLLASAADFTNAGLRYAQDIVWEKHNGSGFHADRFKRVHEHAVQFYRAECPWGGVYNDVQKTSDATKRTVRRKKRPAHMGHTEQSAYRSDDGGPRIMRSVLMMRSMHGRAIHPTEKPAALLEILIKTSCPPDGLVADFFAGSGSAAEAAAMTGRNYIGCEIDPEIAQRARNRLAGGLFSTGEFAA